MFSRGLHLVERGQNQQLLPPRPGHTLPPCHAHPPVPEAHCLALTGGVECLVEHVQSSGSRLKRAFLTTRRLYHDHCANNVHRKLGC